MMCFATNLPTTRPSIMTDACFSPVWGAAVGIAAAALLAAAARALTALTMADSTCPNADAIAGLTSPGIFASSALMAAPIDVSGAACGTGEIDLSVGAGGTGPIISGSGS
jgi:hypothetical protein